jgi:hypothetical protein
MKKGVKDVRVIRVRQLFVARYPRERTANQVLAFFLWLQHHNPDLLPSGRQDNRYQGLKADLSGLYLQE